METFDKIASTTIEDSKVTLEERVRIEDTLYAEAMQEACGMFLTAERKFRKISEHPDVVTKSPSLRACERGQAIRNISAGSF